MTKKPLIERKPPAQQSQGQAQPTPMQRRTILGNNALGAMQAFYNDALSEEVKQAHHERSVLKTLSTQNSELLSEVKFLKETIDELALVQVRAEAFFESVQRISIELNEAKANIDGELDLVDVLRRETETRKGLAKELDEVVDTYSSLAETEPDDGTTVD